MGAAYINRQKFSDIFKKAFSESYEFYKENDAETTSFFSDKGSHSIDRSSKAFRIVIKRLGIPEDEAVKLCTGVLHATHLAGQCIHGIPYWCVRVIYLNA